MIKSVTYQLENTLLSLLELFLQYVLPKVWLTSFVGWFANKKAGWLTRLTIFLFVKYYKIDMNEAKIANIADYLTFNDFFSRQLRKNIRPLNIDPNVLIIPADGTISQFGKIEENNIFLVKGQNSDLKTLLGGNYLIAEKFRNGIFVMIYLSPKDCHRVYMPCDGILREMIYIPGNLFSVNQLITKNIKNVFTRNERVICLFDTVFGQILQILVGSTIVGSIEVSWFGTIHRRNFIENWTWSSSEERNSIILLKGQEMGRFKLGSTVITIFTPGKINLVKTIKNQLPIKIGQPMAVSTNNFHYV